MIDKHGCLVTVLTAMLLLGGSWLISVCLIWLICLCFGWAFSWSAATGVWLGIMLIRGVVEAKMTI